jgi:hypothetical protein
MPKSHRYLVDIPTDLWVKSQQKANAQGVSMRAFLVDLLRKDLVSPNPSELLPVLDMQTYQQKLHETSRAVDEMVRFLNEKKSRRAVVELSGPDLTRPEVTPQS